MNNQTDISSGKYISSNDVSSILEEFYAGKYKDKEAELSLDLYRIYLNIINEDNSMSRYIKYTTENRKLPYLYYSLLNDIVRVLNDNDFVFNVSLYSNLLTILYEERQDVKSRTPIASSNARNGTTEFIFLLRQLGSKSLLELLNILRNMK